MRDSAVAYLRPGETVQAVLGAQTASQLVAAVSGVFLFLGLNRYRIVVVTPQRVLILDAGRASMKTALGVVAELPRSTRLGPASGFEVTLAPQVNGREVGAEYVDGATIADLTRWLAS